MRRTKTRILGKRGVFLCLALPIFLNFHEGFSQTLPGRNDIISHKISAVIVNKSIVINEKKINKQYADTVKYDVTGFMIEKRITAYDTILERELAGDWTYQYDASGNRTLETRKSADYKVMDYFNYVYDSNRITKQIWVYWVNLKLLFNRIYEVKYDGYGRLNKELIEDGTEKLDTILVFKYDSTNRMNKIITARDKDCKDTINTVNYFFNPNGSVAKTITVSKTSKSTEEFTYDASGKIIKDETDAGTTTYVYDKNGLLSSTEKILKDKKGMKYKFNYTYLYR